MTDASITAVPGGNLTELIKSRQAQIAQLQRQRRTPFDEAADQRFNQLLDQIESNLSPTPTTYPESKSETDEPSIPVAVKRPIAVEIPVTVTIQRNNKRTLVQMLKPGLAHHHEEIKNTFFANRPAFSDDLWRGGLPGGWNTMRGLGG